MTPQETKLIARIDALLAGEIPNDTSANRYQTVMALIQSTQALLHTVYGTRSGQEVNLVNALNIAMKDEGIPANNIPKDVLPVVLGTLRALKGDIESGLAGSLERRGEGTVLSDMLLLAKDANSRDGDGNKNVAAVLAAASFEDVIRRMGASFANVEDRPDLQDVVSALKKADVLKGPSVSAAVGYLKFRNDALHADWKNIDRAAISGVIAFVEGLVLLHFA